MHAASMHVRVSAVVRLRVGVSVGLDVIENVGAGAGVDR